MNETKSIETSEKRRNHSPNNRKIIWARFIDQSAFSRPNRSKPKNNELTTEGTLNSLILCLPNSSYLILREISKKASLNFSSSWKLGGCKTQAETYFAKTRNIHQGHHDLLHSIKFKTSHKFFLSHTLDSTKDSLFSCREFVKTKIVN